MIPAISSIVTDDTVLSVKGTPAAAAARAVARSPSVWMTPCTPTGARKKGTVDRVPSTVVARSRSDTSRPTRGQIRSL